MVQVDIVYEGDLHCVATHEPSRRKLQTDAPVDNQGRGESFSPTDLVGTALGTCILTTLGIIARRQGIDLKGATCQVRKEMTTSGPRRIERLGVEIRIPGHISHDNRTRFINAAETCPVYRSLHPDVQAPITFHWDGE